MCDILVTSTITPLIVCAAQSQPAGKRKAGLAYVCANLGSWSRHGASLCACRCRVAGASYVCARPLRGYRVRGRMCLRSHVEGTTTHNTSSPSSRRLHTMREALPVWQWPDRAPLSLIVEARRGRETGVALVGFDEFTQTHKVSSSIGFADVFNLAVTIVDVVLRMLSQISTHV
jgi:hypothetical protein